MRLPILPLFLTEKNKTWVGILVFVITAGAYMITNHNPIFEPMLLPFLWIDHQIPFVVESIWIYTSEYYYFIVAFYLSRSLSDTNKFFYSIVFLFLTSSIIFWLWPTTFPRELFPLAPLSVDNSITNQLFHLLRTIDSPTNCAPSSHVSAVYLTAFMFKHQSKKKYFFFLTWATLIAISTMTTKQHYFIDVLLGYLYAEVVYYLFNRVFQYKKI